MSLYPVGFYGKTELENARVDMVVDCLTDVAQPLVAIFGKPEEEKVSFKHTRGSRVSKAPISKPTLLRSQPFEMFCLLIGVVALRFTFAGEVLQALNFQTRGAPIARSEVQYTESQ